MTRSGLPRSVLKAAVVDTPSEGLSSRALSSIAENLAVVIPNDPEQIDLKAEALLSFADGGNWGVAALVSSRTKAGTGGPRTDAMLQQLSYRAFAEKGLRGLSDPRTVKFYAEVWESRFPKPVPGEIVELPDEEFPRRVVRELGPPTPPPPLPVGTYDVLLADPPWQYDFAETDSRQIENQYPTMDAEAIAALEVPAAPNAVLYLWATAPKLREALRVMESWGFTYVTDLVWVKDRIGMGYWARGRHELLLVGTRGTPGAPEPGDRPDSVIEAPRGEHSVKPAAVYDLIETAMPDRTYLELFARTGRDGWTSWGNEIV